MFNINSIIYIHVAPLKICRKRKTTLYFNQSSKFISLLIKIRKIINSYHMHAQKIQFLFVPLFYTNGHETDRVNNVCKLIDQFHIQLFNMLWCE